MIKKLALGIAVLLLTATTLSARHRVESGPLTLWYKAPAADWNGALPIGNGRLGAMIFGNADNELLQLNENTLYSGEPATRFTDLDITPAYPEMVRLLEEERYQEASELLKQWTGRLHECYQPLGDWHIRDYRGGKAKAYRRSLDLERAVATVQYERDNYQFRREIFASHPDEVIVMRLTTNCPVGWDIAVSLSSPHPVKTAIDARKQLVSMSGRAPGRVDRRNYSDFEAWGHEARHPYLFNADGSRTGKPRVLYAEDMNGLGMFFESRLEVRVDDPKAQITDLGAQLRIRGAKEILLVFSAATSFNGPFKSPSSEGVDAAKLAMSHLKKVRTKTYEQLLANHEADYRTLFGRLSLELPTEAEAEALPTDLRIQRYAAATRTTGKPNDQALVTLLFQYGRYLMISGSREEGQPLNLQGIWNKDIIPSWNGGYTANINAEMNYWPAEVTNLSECHEPFLRMVEECAETGAETARNMYHRRGWVGHHNCSIWRETYPNDGGAATCFWPMMGAWFSTHLWEHYAYTGDKEYLREVYPTMREASKFFLDWLTQDKEGYWQTPISTSPENLFLVPGSDFACGVSQGSTGDMAMIRELFTHTIAAARIVEQDAPLCDTLRNRLDSLLPYRIGAAGNVQEWKYDFADQDPHHRHVTHLLGLYPFGQITPQNEALFAAARRTLEIRGDEATGWSSGWKINLWARLLDGERAFKLIGTLLRPVGFGPDALQSDGGGVYANLFDAHPPFQIDGNLGFTAGVCEMLMQSHEGFIRLMPAVPAAWHTGHIKGLVARGGYEIEMAWSNGRITTLKIHSRTGNRCKVVSDWALPEIEWL
ncbi:MAG: glycoside hydrolase N-terminal domain-containing protein [Alistipes sp.]|nr:glycoside hydrolase N-terminal domain-containing protein [Alistipes sp.]